ncbi:nitrate- and nitrite sensing domain-containing protein [Streptomyces sp. NPDC090029]|uniref:nitrate- and nitrite sensing domain-containing protein n=1 Tax=Streptomyces sp. NPDC090029 TaxID=3365924 RepID=UPI0038049C32
MPTPRTSPGDESARPGPGPTSRRRRAHAGPPAVEHTGHADSSATPRPGAGSTAGSSGGRRLLPRARSVRARIVCLLMVPVVALLTLWGLATVTTAQDFARARLLQRLDTRVADPAAAAVTALKAERHAALRQSASPSGDRAAALRAAASRTDAAVDRLAPHGGRAPDGLPREVGARLAAFLRAAGELPAVRRAATSGDADREAAFRTYTSAVESALAVGGATSSFRTGADASRARALAEVERSAEMLAREDALLSSARLTGELDAAHQRLFTGAAAARTALGEAASTGLDGPARPGGSGARSPRTPPSGVCARPRNGSPRPHPAARPRLPSPPAPGHSSAPRSATGCAPSGTVHARGPRSARTPSPRP